MLIVFLIWYPLKKSFSISARAQPAARCLLFLLASAREIYGIVAEDANSQIPLLNSASVMAVAIATFRLSEVSASAG